ncbi:MAG: hypothetical protein J7578_11100 [Chitinophagaceae bacterium]|nr:hypothetical protein [Chitinophagaceae bacterium]
MIRSTRYTVLLCLFFFPAMLLHAQSKSNLKVLFVGYDPAKPMPDAKRSFPGMMSKEVFTADYTVRMPAFKGLLSQYFTVVSTIDCRDWKPSDSDPFDVTIFDFKPNPLPEATGKSDAEHAKAKYLPEGFSKPVVFISSTAAEMGEGIGLKLDWLCLCLDADAHHMKKDHAIFKGPLEKVNPTMEMKKTPDGVFHYTTGANIPKEIPMWKVQKVGYTTGDQCRIGLVSRGNRFTEGPDAEVISSGVCLKDVGAVALGRHGNFFLWGFGVSPAQMTEEAKKVFVNVVAYMKQFDGKLPITKKYNQSMATTNDVRERIANTSRKSFEEYVEEIRKFNEHNAAEKKRIDDKKAAGQALTSAEEESLQYIGRAQLLPVWDEYVKQMMGKYAATFGDDTEAFQKFMRANLDYIYCNAKGFFEYDIDEDVQAIGVPNHGLKLLDKCIGMLAKNDRPDLALRVLKKYTAEDLNTAKEWSNWLAKNRKKLYFSETNGYRFMINTYN